MEAKGLLPGEDSLESRVVALHDRVRRQNLLVSVLILAVLTLVLIAAKHSPPGSLVARSFVLVDEGGETRAELAMATVLSNRPGVLRTRVPYLRLYDEGGGTRAEIMLGPDGSPRIALNARSLPTAVELGIDKALGIAQVRLFHVENQGFLQLTIDTHGRARVLVRDTEGKVLDVR